MTKLSPENVFFHPFPSCPFPLFFHLKLAPQSKEFGGVQLALPSGGEHLFAASRRIPGALDMLKMHLSPNAFCNVFGARGTCLVAANIVLFLLNEI